MSEQKVEKNIVTELKTNAFTREGYSFKEWNTKENGSGTSFADKAEVTLEVSLDLFAQWNKVEVHTHHIEKVEAVEPGCETDGNKTYYRCMDEGCDKWFEDETMISEITDKSSVIIKAIGHKWDDGEITREATYDEDGEKTYTCQNDPSHTKKEPIPKKTRSDESDSDNTTNENDSSSGTGDDSVNNGENTADTSGDSKADNESTTDTSEGSANVSRRIGGESDSSSSSDSSGSGSSSSDSGSSSSSSSSGSSSKTYTTAQTKVDQVNNVTSFKVPENHQVETGVPASDVGGKWGNSANTDTWTYTKSDGTLAKGEWMSLDYNGLRYWYYFNDDGNMHTNWFDYKGERFYLMPDKDGWRGRMATGWKKIDSKWYYFDINPGSSQGKLYRGTLTPDGHQVGADGAWNGVGTTPVGQE